MRRCRSCTSANCLALKLSRNFEGSRDWHATGGLESGRRPVGTSLPARPVYVFNSGNGPIAEPEEPMEPAKSHPHTIEIEEVSQLELPVGAISGYQLVNGERRPLPIGSSLKRGVFYWQPGPGFLGQYLLVFEHTDGTESHLRVKIRPKTFPR